MLYTTYMAYIDGVVPYCFLFQLNYEVSLFDSDPLKNAWQFLTLPVICRNKNRKLWKKHTLPTISYFDLRWILKASWGQRPWDSRTTSISASFGTRVLGRFNTSAEFTDVRWWVPKSTATAVLSGLAKLSQTEWVLVCDIQRRLVFDKS